MTGTLPLERLSALLARLEAKWPLENKSRFGFINHDGPEAAEAIRALIAKVKEMEAENVDLKSRLSNSIGFAGGQSPATSKSGSASARPVRKARLPERVDCPVCGAVIGKPCRTRHGYVAEISHAPRLRQARHAITGSTNGSQQ